MTLRVALLDSMGSDLSVVNAARASFGKESQLTAEGELKPADVDLIGYLARGLTRTEMRDLLDEMVGCFDREGAEVLLKRIRRIATHEQPFAQVELQMRLTAPLAVARQMWKSHIGSVGGDAGYGAWSEESGRYIGDARTAFMPQDWRSRPGDIKQGSSEPIDEPHAATVIAWEAYEAANKAFARLRDLGVAPEQARMVLPQGMETTWVWKGSLLFFSRVCRLRQDAHAQREAQVLADMIAQCCKGVAPVSWRALNE